MSRKRGIFIGVFLAVLLLGIGALAWYQFSPGKRLVRHLVKARLSAQNGQPALALQEYDSALAIDPKNDVALVESGFARLALGQPEFGAQQFEAALKLYPKDKRAWLGLARARFDLKDFAKSTDAAEHLLGLERSADSLLILADIQAAQEKYEPAMEFCRQAAETAPADFQPVLAQVRLYRQMRISSRIKPLLKNYIAREDAKDRQSAYVALAEAELAANHPADALQAYEKAIAIKSTPELLLRRAEVLCQVKDFRRAQPDIDAMLAKPESASPLAHKLQAICLFERGELDGAFREAQLAGRALPQDAQVALLLARIHRAEKHSMQAEDEARRALLVQPDFAPAQDFLMDLLLEQRQYEKAITLGRSLADRPRPNPRTARQLAYAFLAGGQSHEAGKLLRASGPATSRSQFKLPEFKQVESNSSKSALSEYLRGDALLKSGDMLAATLAFEHAAELDPDFLEPHLSLAGLRLNYGNTDRAIHHLEKAIAADVSCTRAFSWLAQLYQQGSRWSDLDRLYTRWMTLEQGLHEPMIGLIHVRVTTHDAENLKKLSSDLQKDADIDCRALGLVAEAEAKVLANDESGAHASFDEALKLSPGLPLALHEKGVLLIRQGKCADAVPLLKEAAQAAQLMGSPLRDYIAARILAGDLDESVWIQAQLEALLSNSAGSALLLVSTGAAMNRADAAKSMIESSGTLAPETRAIVKLAELPNASDVLKPILRAELYTRADRKEWVFEELQTALQTAPENRDLKILAGSSFAAAGKKDEGVKLLQEVVEKDSRDIPATQLLARILQSKQEYPKAQKYYESALSCDPQNPQLLSGLGTVCMLQGNCETAQEMLLKATRAAPEDIVALNNLVWMTAVDMKAPQRALPYAQDLLRLAPGNASALDTAGWVCFLNGQYEAALQASSAAAILAPDNAAIAYRHGLALLKNRQNAAAQTELRRAQTLPDSQSLKFQLEQALQAARDGSGEAIETSHTATEAK